MSAISQENECQTQDSACGYNENMDAEITIPATIAQNGGPYSAIIDGQNYMIAIPAGVSSGQVVQVKAQASGKPQRTLSVRILFQQIPATKTNPPANTKSKWVALFLAAFPYTGLFGVHDFYLGNVESGILKLCTINVLCLGWIVDIIRILIGSYAPLIKNKNHTAQNGAQDRNMTPNFQENEFQTQNSVCNYREDIHTESTIPAEVASRSISSPNVICTAVF